MQCIDVEPDPTAGGGSVHIRASKTDQHGAGATRYIGPATRAAVGRALAASGHTTGPLYESRSWPMSWCGSAGTRCGWEARVIWRRPVPAWRICSRRVAGGRLLHRDPCRPGPDAPIVAQSPAAGQAATEYRNRSRRCPALVGSALAREGYPRCWQQAAT